MTVCAPSRAPERSLDQRLDALARANLVRTARKEMKAWLGTLPPRASTERSARLVREPLVGVNDTMKVYDQLLACRGLGHVGASKLLRRLHISPSKTVGGLSPRQRDALTVALEELARQRRSTH